MTESHDSVAGVRIGTAGKLYYVDAVGMRLDTGDYVVIESSRGPRLARVVIGTEQVVVNELRDDDLMPVLRLATEADIERAHDLDEAARNQLPEARSLAEKAGLAIHIDHLGYTLDGATLLVAYSTEAKEDVRRFAHELGALAGARVDMSQVGARDRARLAGGYGICGRELCCSSWLSTFPSISIRMAKNQEKPLNPQKISGLCGRLLCCLSYEDEGYKEMRETLPRVGQRCSTPTGEGKVIGINVLRREVMLFVSGQRVVATDRDLGTVVRWDPRSRDAEPPPSIAPLRAEPPEEQPEPAARIPVQREPAERPPSRGQRRPARPSTQGSGGAGARRVRKFERRSESAPEGSADTPSTGRPGRQPESGGDAAGGQGKPSRRTRGGRRGGRRGRRGNS